MNPIALVAVVLSVFAAGVLAQKPRDRFVMNGPQPGTAAPDFELQTLDGKTIRGSALWREKPTVLMTGSYTCPVFRGKESALERLAKDFAGKVNFLILYTTEAHPSGDPSPYRGREWVTPANEREGILIPQPKTMADRRRVAEKCATTLKLSVPVAVDTIENATWEAYGSAPNCAYLIGRDGKIVAQHGWFDPATMRISIETMLKK